MNERNRQLTIAALQKLVADSTGAAHFRRAATLRLARIRSVTRPAPTVESLVAGVKLARDTHADLRLQRRALLKKPHLQKGEESALFALLELPDLPPRNASTGDLCAFVGGVSAVLGKLKALKA